MEAAEGRGFEGEEGWRSASFIAAYFMLSSIRKYAASVYLCFATIDASIDCPMLACDNWFVPLVSTTLILQTETGPAE